MGIALALVAAMSWGSLPIAMKVVLQVMDPFTVVFCRFFLAALGLGTVLALKHQLPPRDFFRHPRWLVCVVVATAGLVGNFVLFGSSLQYLSPTASQVIAQLAPPGMMLASVFILKEKMRISQIIGVCMLMCGLGMFFNTSLVEIFTRLTNYTWGVILGVSAALVWVVYGVTQKILLRRLGSQQILFMLYTLCAVSLLPFAHADLVWQLDRWQLGCLIFCALNTLVGYGALAEAYARWQAAQVSAIVTLTPLFTLLFSEFISLGWPDFFAIPQLNTLGFVGAIVVVSGAMFSATGHRLWPLRSNPVPVPPASGHGRMSDGEVK